VPCPRLLPTRLPHSLLLSLPFASLRSLGAHDQP
jgi:hypothetical protein